jgi:anti-sigma factor RsiW
MKSSTCSSFQGLVPGYMDGELSEEQAAPLRRHLLSCPACRTDAQDLGNLAHWFPAPPAVEIPLGFAARVARAAFAGETEVRRPEPERVAPAPVAVSSDTNLRGFVLGLTSIAATILLCLALFMAQEEQPAGPELSAAPIPEALQELDRLNAAEAAPALPPTEASVPERR